MIGDTSHHMKNQFQRIASGRCHSLICKTTSFYLLLRVGPVTYPVFAPMTVPPDTEAVMKTDYLNCMMKLYRTLAMVAEKGQ